MANVGKIVSIVGVVLDLSLIHISFTNEGIGCAIMNRLLKSAGYKIIGA